MSNDKSREFHVPGLSPLSDSKSLATTRPVTEEEAERIIEEVADRILAAVLPKLKASKEGKSGDSA